MVETTQEKVGIPTAKRGSGRRGRDRRPGSRRHRKVVAGNRDVETN